MASLAASTAANAKYKKRDKIYYRQDRGHSSRPGYVEKTTNDGSGFSLRLYWNGTVVSQAKVSAIDARTHLRAAEPGDSEYRSHAAAWEQLDRDMDARCDKGKRFGNLVMVGSASELPFDWMPRLLAAGPHPSKVVTGSELREFIAGAPFVTDGTAIPSPPPTKSIFQVRP